MATPTDVVTAMDRVMDVLAVEFPQLPPPDVTFMLQALAAEYISQFLSKAGAIKRQH